MDPRLTPARPDLAAAHLAGTVEAERYGEATLLQVSAGVAAMRKQPLPDARQETQLLFGEVIAVYDERDGFGWGQALRDGYVGHVDMAALSGPPLAPTHRVQALRTYVFSEADLKSAPRMLISLNAEVTVEAMEGRYAKIARSGWVAGAHLAPIDGPWAPDWVGEAARFLGAPYLWGGKESLGLDCSGLIQMAMHAAGLSCPRDSDMQEEMLGAAVAPTLEARARGDLVFWGGHVGVMLDAETLLHANAHHMAVTAEPLAEAAARIAATAGPIRTIKRL